MAFISERDRETLRTMLAELTRPVRLVFFTQTFGCETCGDARRILDELAELSPLVTVVERNLVLEPDLARDYGIDRAPTTAIVTVEEDGTERDYGIRFVGVTSGYEFSALVDALLLASRGDSRLSEESLALLADVQNPVRIQVFVTPT